MDSRRREKILINGVVQGVGFRPFVYRLAQECHLAGFVHNNSSGILIEVEGTPNRLDSFHQRLRSETPPLARIVHYTAEALPPKGEQTFSIVLSERESFTETMISPDICVCPDCLSEMQDPANRRYRYPFINCTNCGPRYTITRALPYDRPLTSMATFDMCDACSREYHDPGNRRFHAQPNACPSCGPGLILTDSAGEILNVDDVITRAVEFLHQGRIIAIKGIGGFHLAVDAHNETAVRELRHRKGRGEKPFALMAADLAVIQRFCHVSGQERHQLNAANRPIVLLRKKQPDLLAPSLAPRQNYFGLMLPYTPLHYLLLSGNFDTLVMTSGNLAEEPIAIDNAEAIERLGPLADFLIMHDREILQRCDDSICRVSVGETRLIRRSRGFVPEPVFLAAPTQTCILACGGELKNTVALSRQSTVFLSQHIGDLDNPSALSFFENSIGHLQNTLEIAPEAIAYDLHPEYLSTKWALEQEGVTKIGVQHHHAHLASVLAENQEEEATIGIILDGTGYGPDRTIWGGEVLLGAADDFERFAWLSPVPLAGGAAAIREPWRMAVSYLMTAYGSGFADLDIPIVRNLKSSDLQILMHMIETGLNSPLTSSCGRLFDAVSALLGIRDRIDYEAQAAIELEMSVDEQEQTFYDDVIPAADFAGALSMGPIIRSIVQDQRIGIPPGRIAARFHRTIAEAFVKIAVNARAATGINQVALSGGVFQNDYFFRLMLRLLRGKEFRVLTHKIVPCNDGGLALGQIVIADQKLRRLSK